MSDPLVGVDTLDERPRAQLPRRRTRKIDSRGGNKQHGDDEQGSPSP